MPIPKVIVQTSRQPPFPYVVNIICNKSPGWDYKHFTDADVIHFFTDNPLPEFPDVINKFYSFSYGEHRADLFRYYYLYVKGGVYIDTDAMITTNIDEIIPDVDFFTVNSNYFPGTFFQGFIGCVPGNIIIYEALKDLYNIDNQKLIQHFHQLCQNMYNMVNNNHYNCKIKLFEEIYGNATDAHIIDVEQDNKLVLIHYHIKKIIPQ
jgi:mannosyltransferase OCH1-like enzyme